MRRGRYGCVTPTIKEQGDNAKEREKNLRTRQTDTEICVEKRRQTDAETLRADRQTDA